MRTEGVTFTKFGDILCCGCSVVTPPGPIKADKMSRAVFTGVGNVKGSHPTHVIPKLEVAKTWDLI